MCKVHQWYPKTRLSKYYLLSLLQIKVDKFQIGGETMEVSVEYIYLGIIAMLGVGGVISVINKRKDYQPRPDKSKEPK